MWGGKIDSHFYGLSYGRCYWCDRAQNLGIDIFSGNPINYSSVPIFNNQPVSSRQVNHAKSLTNGNNSSKIQKQLIASYLSVLTAFKKNKLLHQLKPQIYWKKLIGLLLFLAAIISISIYWNLTTNANYYFLKAVDYDKLEKYDEAILNYNKAIEINPDNADYYYNRGDSYYNLDKYDEAISNYDKAIKLNPDKFNSNYADAYYNRGSFKDSVGDKQGAIADFNKAIKINPNNADYYSYRGVSYYNLKNYDEAILNYNKAIRINPDNAAYYYNRGLSYYNLKNYDEAIVNYDETIKINPKNADYYYERGKSYHRLGKYDEAMSNYDKATKINPNNNEAKKDYDQAKKDYDQAKKEKSPKGTYKVKVTWSGGLSLRSNPSKDSERVSHVDYDEDLIVLETSADGVWAKVRPVNGGQEGWVKFGNFTILTPSNKINIDDEFLPHKRTRRRRRSPSL